MSSIDDLVVEATRQLNICNSCRYCEGYCAVFPALERRTVLDLADISHLANLCHDCRACFHACMYSEPHDFAINPPAVLSAVRVASYDTYVPKLRVPWIPRRLTSGPAVTGLTTIVIAALVALTAGLDALWKSSPGPGSPYDVISFPVLLVTVFAPLVFAGVVAVRAVVLYWRDMHGRARDLISPRLIIGSLRDAATLRLQRGGGDDCYYPSDRPSAARRHLHATLMYGFLLCIVSTTSAAFMQDVLGIDPPYPYLSAPVLSGLVGGIMMVVGCTGLIILKARSDASLEAQEMVARDYGLLTALNGLAITGLLTLFTRNTPVFNLVLITHLACVVVAFAIFPYTKFMHLTYRFMAIVKEHQERATGVR